MTFDYTIIPVRHDAVGSTDKIQGFARKRKAVSRRFKKDRRKQGRDRRSGIRDGVIVSLSFKNDRRKGTDRRRRILSRVVV